VPDRYSSATQAQYRTPAVLAEARLGQHLAHLYTTPQERTSAAAELLAAAMARGERALGLASEAALGGLASALTARGVDVATAAARGALQLVPHREHYLADGAFDPAQVIRAWQARTEAALAAGFTGLVAVTDMDWALGGAPGSERLLEYEAAQGLTFGRHFAGMCQYDTTRFPAPLLRGVLRTHALLVHQGQVLRNPTALPPEVSCAPEPAEVEVERLLAALHAHGQAEAALRRSEERFLQLAEGARDLVYRYRLSPEPGFEYVSPSATAITGYTPEEHFADPQLALRLVHPEDRERFKSYALDPTPGPLLLRWIRKDGAVVWAEQQSLLVRDESGEPLAIQGIARDVTERMAAEEALRGAERTAAIGRLAAGVSHELNNPLAWMGSNIHFVQQALAELETKGAAAGLVELRQALGEVIEGVERVRAIVGALQHPAGPARAAEPQAELVAPPVGPARG